MYEIQTVNAVITPSVQPCALHRCECLQEVCCSVITHSYQHGGGLYRKKDVLIMNISQRVEKKLLLRLLEAFCYRCCHAGGVSDGADIHFSLCDFFFLSSTVD